MAGGPWEFHVLERSAFFAFRTAPTARPPQRGTERRGEVQAADTVPQRPRWAVGRWQQETPQSSVFKSGEPSPEPVLVENLPGTNIPWAAGGSGVGAFLQLTIAS